MGNRNNRVRLRVEVLEDRSVPAAHGFLPGSASLLTVSPAAAIQSTTTDNTGDGEVASSGPDTDTIQAGPGSQTESTGNTSDNTSDSTSDSTADSTSDSTAAPTPANPVGAVRAVSAPPVHLAHHGHSGHPGHHGHHHHHHR
jgi:hypothetical protein